MSEHIFSVVDRVPGLIEEFEVVVHDDTLWFWMSLQFTVTFRITEYHHVPPLHIPQSSQVLGQQRGQNKCSRRHSVRSFPHCARTSFSIWRASLWQHAILSAGERICEDKTRRSYTHCQIHMNIDDAERTVIFITMCFLWIYNYNVQPESLSPNHPVLPVLTLYVLFDQ